MTPPHVRHYSYSRAYLIHHVICVLLLSLTEITIEILNAAALVDVNGIFGL